MVRWDIGDHIEVRPLEEHLAEEIFLAVERNREHLRRWLPWVDHTLGVEDVQNFLARAVEAYAQGEEMQAGIFIHGKLAGAVGHHRIDALNRNVSIGYWLDAAIEGRGVMTRCCRRMIEYLFEERRMHRVEIRCATGNTRSCAIPARLGFARDGVLREAERVNDRFVDLVVWSLLEQDYVRGLPPTSSPAQT
jgi:ribosomal-protein-serine acetyltransferase